MLASLTTRLVRGALPLIVLILASCGGSNNGSFDASVVGQSVDGAPTLLSVEISTDSSSTDLEMGDVVTVVITASEAILAPSVTIAGDSADSVTGNGDSWIATRAMMVGDPDGFIEISVSFSDISGVQGETVTAATVGSPLSFQNPDPLQLLQDQSDEFPGTSLDLSKWGYENGDGTEFGIPGWGNNELQIYAPEQATVAGGNLIITADEPTSGNFVSARLRSETVVDMSREAGRVEVRAKMPSGQGLWPAIWMLPTQDVVDEFGFWPLTGEVDIVEAVNLGVGGKQTLQSTIHYGFPFPNNSFDFVLYEPGLNPQDDFHTYAMEWETDNEAGTGEIRFYFNDIHYATHSADNWFAVQFDEDGGISEVPAPAPFNRTFNIMLNVAVGGNLPGNPDGTATFPQTMEVDYVRVFDCEFPAAGDCTTGIDSSITPQPGTGGVSIDELEVYSGVAPNTLSFTVSGEEQTNTLSVGAFNPNGELMINDFDAVDPDDATNSVWRLMIAGGVANAFIGSEDLTDNPLLETGFDFGGADFAGQLLFDMRVDQLADGTQLVVKMDSGFPDLGQVTLTDITVGAWDSYSVSLADLVNSPLPDGTGLDLRDVLNLFIIEATGADPAAILADVYIDNIRIQSACPANSSCGLDAKTAATGELIVFDDALNPVWEDGLRAFDQAIGFDSCIDDNGAACPSVNWSIPVADDASRGNVVQVDYAADAQFAGLILGLNSGGVDLTEFASGEIVFDLNVTANPTSAAFIVKADCVDCPVDGGQREQNLGVPAAGWNEFRVPVADLINANGGPSVGGLKIESVTTGLVIFPAFGSTAGVSYQIDNVRWLAGDGDGDGGSGSTTGTGAVYADALDGQWVDGLSAFDQAIGFSSCANDDGAGCPSVSWAEVAAADAARGTVLDIAYAADAQFAGVVVGLNNAGLDMSSFADGNLVFDLNMVNNPNGVTMVMKVDCVGCPTDGGQREQSLGVPADGWQTITIPVADLINANGGPATGGLVIESVTTGLVIFPAFASDATNLQFQLDDVRWEAAGGSGGGSGGGGSGSSGVDGNSGTAANPVINFDDPVGTYNLSDFGNTSSGLAMDPADSSNTVVMTTKPATAEVWAGTTVNGGLLVYPLTATDNIMTVRVYSPAVGLTVRLKAEQAGTPENFVETDALTTVADAWETLTFDFGNPANGAINDTHTYDTLSIFFNFGATGTEYVFYWDDVTFVGGTSGTTTVVGTGAVYEDALDAQWTSGISAFDQAIGFASCTDDGGAGCPSVSWAEVAATDVARGTVLEVTYAGDAQFAGMIIGLNDDGLDMTEFAAGNIVFDIDVTANPSSADFVMKVDCVGCPVDAGQREQNLGLPAAGWNTYSIPVADLINASGGPGVGGLVIESVTTGLVIFPAFGSTAGVTYQIDDIRWEAGAASPVGAGAVYEDALDAQWADGLSAFDQAIGFGSCVDDNGAACPSMGWSEVAATDVARGTVLEVTYAGDAQFAGMIVGGAASGIDLSAFSSGNLVFDLNVTANPSSAAFIMKVDCVGCPVDGGQREQNLGVPAAGWNTISVPVADLINANGGPGSGGLVIESVTTGLVLFPAFGSTAGVSYQLDDVRWETGT